METKFSDGGNHIHFYSDIINKRRAYTLDSHFAGVCGSRYVLTTYDKGQLKKFFQQCLAQIEEDERNDKYE